MIRLMTKGGEKLRICLAASAGGHLTQLLLLSDSWQRYNAIYVSTADIVAKKLQQYGRTYVIGECNRQHLFKSLLVLRQCIVVVLKERPNVVMSTGAAPGLLLCLAAKILGAKIVWIDSIANVEKLSLSGWLVRPIADLFLTQWQEVAEKYKDVEYVGQVI